MWKEFNIKTFPAETVVYRNGVFCPDLSTLNSTDINTVYELPVHIIYTGEISGNCDLDININVQKQPVYLSIDISNNSLSVFNINIKNTGENSEFRGHVLLKNNNDLVFNIYAEHLKNNTDILVKTKLVAEKNSVSKLSGTAFIAKNFTNITSDISFSALADKSAKIEFLPCQKISSVPQNASHSASLFLPSDAQIQYLRSAGLSGAEVQNAMRDAFINDFNLF